MHEPAQQLAFPRRPVVLGIAGCSGSGKTTLARELAGELNATLLPLDLYYRVLAHMSPEERARTNFDHPDSLEAPLLCAHVERLAAGHAIDAPVYDFSTHTRVAGAAERMTARDVLIVEGILALHYAELRPLYDVAVYVDTPHAVCLTRRIHRDVHERGRTEESVRVQFAATALPMAERYVVPSRAHAQVVVEGTDSLDWSVEQVLAVLRRTGLPRA